MYNLICKLECTKRREADLKKIKELREKQNLSQQELADKAEISRVYLSRLESGKEVRVSVNVLVKISNALNVKPSIFLPQE